MTAKRTLERLYAYRAGALPLSLPVATETVVIYRALLQGHWVWFGVLTAVVIASVWFMLRMWFPTKAFKREFYRPRYKLVYERDMFEDRTAWKDRTDAALNTCLKFGFDHMACVMDAGATQRRTLYLTHEDDLATLKLTL